jgi:aspartate kinase
MNPIVVHKYGGSSLATTEKVQAVARRIADTVDEGYRVVAVVSAMGGSTDELLARAKELSENPNRRELDMLLSVGERVSTALLAIALDELGLAAVSFTGSQAGIITNARHNRARIVEVRAFRVLDELDAGKVVIVAGYQGVSYSREITTLGRGGTDTTAVALAAALDAEHCDICSDVDGVYSADPRVVKNADRIDELSTNEMLTMARRGARVLHRECVEYAGRHGIGLFAKSTFGPKDDTGTVVRMNPAREAPLVTAVVHEQEVGEISLTEDADLDDCLQMMADAGAFPTAVFGPPFRIVVSLDDAHHWDSLVLLLGSKLGDHCSCGKNQGTVTVVGHGLGEEPGLVTKIRRAVEEVVGQPVPMQLNPIELSFIVPSITVRQLVGKLHETLLEAV